MAVDEVGVQILTMLLLRMEITLSRREEMMSLLMTRLAQTPASAMITTNRIVGDMARIEAEIDLLKYVISDLRAAGVER